MVMQHSLMFVLAMKDGKGEFVISLCAIMIVVNMATAFFLMSANVILVGNLQIF